MRKFLSLLALSLAFLPLASYAQRPNPNTYYPNLINGSAGGGASGGAKAGPGRKSSPGRSSPGSVTRSYYTEENPDLTPERALQQQNGAIQQYSNMGYQFETKHQWDKAEKSFQYVLKVSAIRDGVGSPKMVPILQHLAVVSSELGRGLEAVGFQERVFGFAKNQPDPLQIISAGVSLTKLYLLVPDIEKAESTAQEIYKLSQDTASIPPTRKQEVVHFYGMVLRKIHKDGEAQLIDPVASSNGAPNKEAPNKGASSKEASSKEASGKDVSSKAEPIKASKEETLSTKSN